jgi:ketosteroid isomerase-like protein
MSQENVEIVRRSVEAFNDRDLGTVMEMCDPQVEWHTPPDIPDAAVYHGLDEARENVEDLLRAFDDLRVEPLRFEESGDEVVALYRFVGHGTGSGVPIELKVGLVCTFSGGKATRVRFLNDWDKALEAAGLSE